MALLETKCTDEGRTAAETCLQNHLKKYNVPEIVYRHLEQQCITQAELVTFTSDDIKDWCNEHNLKTIERRRFINAVKALPNAEINKPKPSKEKEIVKVYLTKEEKEQMIEFNTMKHTVHKMIKDIGEIKAKNKSNVTTITKEINSFCNQIQIFIEQLRAKCLEIVSLY